MTEQEKKRKSGSSGRLMLELRRSAKPLALFVLLCIGGGVAFGLIFKNLKFQRPWQGYNEVRAEFDDVKGIFPKGHTVRIHGVNVGIVQKARLEDGKAVLTLQIEKKWGKVYRDAKMRIRPVTPLQDLYVNITDRGTPSAGVANADYTVRAQNTVTPVDVSRVLNTFDGDTREHLTVLLDELGTGLGKNGGERLKESFAQLAPFLTVARQTTQVMAQRRRNLRRVVTNFGLLTQALAKRDRDLTGLIRSGNATLESVANNSAQLENTLADIPPLEDTMRSSFTSVRGLTSELDPALRGLRPVADNLDAGLAGFERFGNDATPALKRLRPAIAQLRPMSRTLAPTSRSLASAFTRLNAQAPQYDRLTGELPTCFDSMQQFFHQTLSVLKFADVNGAFPRAETTVDTDSTGGKGINTRVLPSCIDNIPAKAHGTGVNQP